MKTTGHADRVAARRELMRAGYYSAFASPGRPELWVKPKGNSRMAVARRVRDADEDWVILPYPEPATATPEQAAELAKRDGVVLNGGGMPNEPDMITSSAGVEGMRSEPPAAGNGSEQPDSVAPSAPASDPDSDLL